MRILEDQTKALQARLGPKFSVQWVEVTGSTNDDVKRMLKYAQTDRWIVRVAQVQTRGRGTHGRQWETEKESLLLSLGRVGLFPGPEMTTVCLGWTLLGLCRRRGVDARIKWPNDLYVGGKKLSGILCEQSQNAAGCAAYIVGVGINLQGDKSEHAYMGIESKKKVEFCAEVVQAFAETLMEASTDRARAVVLHWHEYDMLEGKMVEVLDSKNHKIRGKVKGIGDKGELVICLGAETVGVLNGSVRIIEE